MFDLRFFDLVMESEFYPVEWNGKHVVWIDPTQQYFIAVNDPESATYVTLWTADNKRIGDMSTRQHPVSGELGRYLGIGKVEIDRKHRGRGLGKQMYIALLKHLAPKWAGIASYLPDQVNKKQVPAIQNKLGGRVIGDYMVVDRKHV